MADGDTIIEGPLYAARKKVYPQAVHGTFRRIKWGLLIATLAVYYLLPFVRWNRGPNLPDQAVLVDLPHRRFYFFWIELWPQEVYYFTGLLIIAAMALFLMNAVAGRIWCGYLCPQTVWTDLFYAVERWVEGDRRERMIKDKGAWTLDLVSQRILKHSIWLIIAWWTGGAWVLYFADAPTLVRELATLQQPDPRRDRGTPQDRAQEERRKQLLQLLAEIEKRINEENARPKKRYISPSTREEVYAIYYDQLRRKIEERGTRNFPEHQGKKLYGELVMIITVDAAGRIVETEVVQGSQSKLLDKRAVSIVQAAAPFGPFTSAMKKQADQLVIPTRFRFSREDGFATSVAEPLKP